MHIAGVDRLPVALPLHQLPQAVDALFGEPLGGKLRGGFFQYQTCLEHFFETGANKQQVHHRRVENRFHRRRRDHQTTTRSATHPRHTLVLQ